MDELSRVKGYREKWLKIGLSTSETNLLRVHDIVRRGYRTRKRKVPSKIVIVDSPLSCLAGTILFDKTSIPLRKEIRGLLHPHFSLYWAYESDTGELYPPKIQHTIQSLIARDLALFLDHKMGHFSYRLIESIKAEIHLRDLRDQVPHYRLFV